MVKGNNRGGASHLLDGVFTLAVVVVNDGLVIKKVKVWTLERTRQQFEAVFLNTATLLSMQEACVVNRHLSLIKDHAFNSAVRPVSVAQGEHRPIAVQRAWNRCIEVIESAHTVCVVRRWC